MVVKALVPPLQTHFVSSKTDTVQQLSSSNSTFCNMSLGTTNGQMGTGTQGHNYQDSCSNPKRKSVPERPSPPLSKPLCFILNGDSGTNLQAQTPPAANRTIPMMLCPCSLGVLQIQGLLLPHPSSPTRPCCLMPSPHSTAWDIRVMDGISGFSLGMCSAVRYIPGIYLDTHAPCPSYHKKCPVYTYRYIPGIFGTHICAF